MRIILPLRRPREYPARGSGAILAAVGFLEPVFGFTPPEIVSRQDHKLTNRKESRGAR